MLWISRGGLVWGFALAAEGRVSVGQPAGLLFLPVPLLAVSQRLGSLVRSDFWVVYPAVGTVPPAQH